MVFELLTVRYAATNLTLFVRSAGTCKWPGASGGLAVLDVIEKKPFLRIYMHLLPAIGGFQAAYLAYDTTNRAVGLLVCAQLIFNDPAMSPLTGEPSEMAAAARCLFRIVAHTASSGAAASMRTNPVRAESILTFVTLFSSFCVKHPMRRHVLRYPYALQAFC